MDKVAHALASRGEAEIPTDLLAGLLMESATAPSKKSCEAEKLTPKIYAVMALTSLSTFAMLTAGYQLLFSHQLFA